MLFTKKVFRLLILLLVVIQCKKNNEIQTLNSDWKYKAGYKQKWLTESIDPKWRTIHLPLNFSAKEGIRKGFITLRKEIPVKITKIMYDGRPIALNAGRTLDVSEFYINDVKIGGKGTVQPYLAGAMRHFIKDIPLQKIYKEKANILTIVLYSKGNFPIQVLDGIKIGTADSIYEEHKNREIIYFIFLSIYLTIGLYHLLLVIKRPQDKYNLYFGLFSLVVCFYWFISYTTMQNIIFEKYAILHRKVEHFFLYLISPLYYAFLNYYFEKKLGVTSRYYLALVTIIALLTLFFPLSVMRICRLIWYITLIVVLLYSTYKVLKKAVYEKNEDARYLIVGMMLIIIGAFNDIAVSNGWYIFPFIGSYTFLAFVLGITAIMANRFMRVTNEVEELNKNLEKKVEERTLELQESLKKVQNLKEKQDGDYFLTSLLIKPLSGNFIRKIDQNKSIQIDILVKQKKSFTFRKKEYEIGGDICIADRLNINNKTYTAFLNADAMGKSIQGAGGVIVLGTVFKSVIERSRENTGNILYPEFWLKECLKELHKVFISFEGSMMISSIFGLIDEESGLLYYINAEHPFFVLYRDKVAEFLENEIQVKKIGMEGVSGNLQVKLFQLQPDDVLITGSDGRDDILLGYTEDGRRNINEDETLFLQHVQKAEGNLENIKQSLLQTGELTDDLSLLKISYHSKLNEKPAATEVATMLMNISRSQQSLTEQIKILEQEYQRTQDLQFIAEIIKLLVRKRLYAKAGLYLDHYIEEKPDHSEAILLNSIVKKKQKRLKQAILLAERFRIREPYHVRNLRHLANCYYISKKYEKANKLIARALAIEPEDRKSIKIKQRIDSRDAA